MNAEQFHRINKALADRRRYEILSRIAKSGELPCRDILCELPISPATLSHHMKELANAGLIEIRREQRFAHIQLRRKVWREYLAQLARL